MLGLEVVVARLQIPDVVQRRTVEIRAAADQERQLGRERLQHVLACFACRDLRVLAERRDRGQGGGRVERDVLAIARWQLPQSRRAFQLCAELRVLFTPLHEGLGPDVVLRAECLRVLREIARNCRIHVVVLRGQAEPLARRVGKLGAALAVCLLRALDLRNALADDGLGDDHLRLAFPGALSVLESLVDGDHVVAVDGLNAETVRCEACGYVGALGLLGHRIERDVVRVVNQD